MREEKANIRADWMAKAGYGLAIHWTAQSMPRAGDRPLPFAESVDEFSVTRMAEQCLDAGAGWLLFTISHAIQHLPFPNQTMDRILPGRTCCRDLMGELADALAAHNIPLIFYYPSVATDDDPQWQQASGWLSDPALFASRQYEIVTEIGQRYGSRLAGWWIDNCYDPIRCPYRWHHLHSSLNGYASLYDFNRYTDALRAGNPNRLVTFNFSGTDSWQSKLGEGIVDYAAGECNALDRVPHAGRFSGEGKSQWHSFAWMDDIWVHTKPEPIALPRDSDDLVISYVRYVIQRGGAFSYGAAAYQDELVAESTMKQLRMLKQVIPARRID